MIKIIPVGIVGVISINNFNELKSLNLAIFFAKLLAKISIAFKDIIGESV